MARIVVVGSGIAGLIAALGASASNEVVLVTKAELAESNTRYAQGGIAVAMSADDSVEAHAADTLAAGAGLGDPDAIAVLCSEGPERIRELIRLGVAFDTTNGELARGLEAAHSSARVLHAGGDATGAAIEAALVAAVRHSGIEVRETTFVSDLVVGTAGVARRDVEGGSFEEGSVEEGSVGGQDAVTGVRVIDRDGRHEVIDADAVVLASGGAGQLFRHTTNPSVATGDGAAAAWRAGAELSDVEFYQFHPTSIAAPGNFLVSEAVRGEGAVLRDSNGRRFMTGVHPRADLAPRDVVARGIAEQMAAQDGRPVLLDATMLGADFLARRFPGIDRTTRALGLDWSRDPIPVTPAAHYWMGGVRTDLSGRTSIPGLFAVGEVACTGVHGANRLASNSLLESLVFAARVGELLAEHPLSETIEHWPRLRARASNRPCRVAPGSVPLTRGMLRDLAWEAIGLYRDANTLRRASTTLAGSRVDGDTVADHETRNLLDLARLMVDAALAREESRGAHFRTDFPDTAVAFAVHLRIGGAPDPADPVPAVSVPATARASVGGLSATASSSSAPSVSVPSVSVPSIPAPFASAPSVSVPSIPGPSVSVPSTPRPRRAEQAAPA